MNMEAHVTTGAAAALTARLVVNTADLMEVTTAVTTVRRAMIGPVHTRQPDQPSPAATAATGPARTFTGPVLLAKGHSAGAQAELIVNLVKQVSRKFS